MDDRRASFTLAGLILLAIVSILGLTWLNYSFASRDPGMNSFLPLWAGTRLFMTRGVSPYSQQTSQEIENLAYRRPAQNGEKGGFFVYPFYSSIIMAPFALFGDLTIARTVWMTVLELSLFGIVSIAIALSQWHPSRWILVALILLCTLWYYSIRVVLEGSVIVLCALFISLAFLAIRSNHDVLAGILFALATINPETVILLTFFVCIWAISQNRWTIIASLVACLAFLIATTSMLISDWVVQYIIQIVAFYKATFSVTPGNVIAYWLPGIGRQLGWVITILMGSMLIWEWKAACGKDFRWFLWTAYLTMAASHLIGIRTSLGNYIYLLPALVLVLAIWYERWGKLGHWLMILSILMLSFGLWYISLNSSKNNIPPDLNVLLFLFVPVFVFSGLYWVRWWAIHPPRLYLETLSKQIS